MINIANNSFETRVLTTRFLKRKFILIRIQEQINVFTHFFFKRCGFLQFMSLNFFKLLVQLSFTKNQFVHFAPQPFRPTLPYDLFF